MVAVLGATPNPVAPTATFVAIGSGFDAEKTRLMLGNTVVSGQFRPSGGVFSINVTAPSSTGTSQLSAQQKPGKSWVRVATPVTLTVQSATTPPVISHVVVDPVAGTTATVSWSVTPAATGQVEYGPVTTPQTYPLVTTLEPNYLPSHSQEITGLTAGTAYAFRCQSANASGAAAPVTGTFSTLLSSPALTVPGAPTSLAAVAGDTTVNLSWVTPASDGGTPITGYRVYRGGVLIASVGVVTFFHDTGRTNGVAYTYTVAAVNFFGVGSPSSSASATPAAAPSTKTVTVSSIAALKTALADNTVDAIVVANGTYHVDIAQAQTTNSLYIGPVFASRTRPITISAQTTGGVTFDGGGIVGGVAGMWFGNGSHDQTWDGFKFANIRGTVIEFGGFTPTAPPHDITMKNITVLASCHQAVTGSNQDHCFYFSNALGRGPYNILLEDITLIGTDATSVREWGGIHGFHGDAANPPPDHVTVRRLTTTGLWYPIILWYDGAGANVHDWTFDGGTMTGAAAYAVRFESLGASAILFKDLTSTGSVSGGFYSSLASPTSGTPPGVTKTNCSLA